MISTRSLGSGDILTDEVSFSLVEKEEKCHDRDGDNT
jgi:hypothetical protein